MPRRSGRWAKAAAVFARTHNVPYREVSRNQRFQELWQEGHSSHRGERLEAFMEMGVLEINPDTGEVEYTEAGRAQYL